jgi:hypothetical protein
MLWIGLALVVAAAAALTGIKAKGTRPVAGTRLMAVGRFVLILLALFFLYLAFRGRA